ncbi:hypothetical protein COO60DRAFT_252798 [Scenedesmus sp. NREL 46B-D3]|nr:hypothetical protein COO60DRAFT_252798 [Scenedesmus sp. NREL 46B-D3]
MLIFSPRAASCMCEPAKETAKHGWFLAFVRCAPVTIGSSRLPPRQVRLKLLPLLLEWDVRQGPQPGPSSGVQFRPTGIRKVSSKGAKDTAGVPARQQHGWRYVLLVERLQQQQQQQQQQRQGADAGEDAEDLAVDLAWIAGTARSRPPKQDGSAAATALSDSAAAAAAGGDYAESELCLSQMPASQEPGFSCSQAAPASQAAGSGGGRSGGSLQFSEHRSVRCSLMEAAWPELVAAYRNPPASSARARSAGRKKAAAAADAPAAALAAALAAADKQRNLKDYFNTVKDYTAAARPSSKAGGMQPAADGGSIPGLAGMATGSEAAAAAAAADPGQGTGLLAGRSSQMPAGSCSCFCWCCSGWCWRLGKQHHKEAAAQEVIFRLA